MANDLHEALARFNVMPDDAVLPSQVTAILLGVSERTIRYHPCKYRAAAMASGLVTFASFAATECPRSRAMSDITSIQDARFLRRVGMPLNTTLEHRTFSAGYSHRWLKVLKANENSWPR